MNQRTRAFNRQKPASKATADTAASLVPPSVPKLLPDLEGAPANTVEFQATFSPLRVEFPMWANSHPSETDNEFLDLYWNGVLVERKTFIQPVRPEELFILVPVSKLIEGPHSLHYEVTLFNDMLAASRPLQITIDKTPPMLDQDDDRLQFDDYILREGVTEDYLESYRQVEATVPRYLGAAAGDSIRWFWSDDPSGTQMAGMRVLQGHEVGLTAEGKTISQPLTLSFPADFIRQSGNGIRFARYEVRDRAGTAAQRSLALSLKSNPLPPPRVLPPPLIRESSGAEYFSTLLPANAANGVTFVVPEGAEVRPGETVTIHWGTPGSFGAYQTSTPKEPGSREYLVPTRYIAPHMNNRVELYYQIDKPGLPQSPTHTVSVQTISGLPYVQCARIENSQLNLKSMGTQAEFTLGEWLFRNTSQFVRAWIEGVERDDTSKVITLTIAEDLPVPTEAGIMTLGAVTKVQWQLLAVNYQFRACVEVSFDDKASWVKFPDIAATLVDK